MGPFPFLRVKLIFKHLPPPKKYIYKSPTLTLSKSAQRKITYRLNARFWELYRQQLQMDLGPPPDISFLDWELFTIKILGSKGVHCCITWFWPFFSPCDALAQFIITMHASCQFIFYFMCSRFVWTCFIIVLLMQEVIQRCTYEIPLWTCDGFFSLFFFYTVE